MVTPGSDVAETTAVGERTRQGIAATPMSVTGGQTHRVTVSVGVAVLPDPAATGWLAPPDQHSTPGLTHRGG